MSTRPSRNTSDRDKEAWKDLTKKQKNGVKIGTVIGIAALAVILVLGGIYGGWFGGTLGETEKPIESKYNIVVQDAWTGKNLTTANISYWNVDSYGDINDMLAYGNMENISMINYAFPTGVVWAKVENPLYKTVWKNLNKTGENIVQMIMLPQTNSSGMIFVEDNSKFTTRDSINGSIAWIFPRNNSGKGFNSTYLADLDVTSYIEMKFVFNSSSINSSNVYVQRELSDSVIVDTTNKNIIVPIDMLFVIADSPSMNPRSIILTINIDHDVTIGLTDIYLMYDNIVYGHIVVPVS